MDYLDKPRQVDVVHNNEELIRQVKELFRISDVALFALYKQIIEVSHNGQ